MTLGAILLLGGTLMIRPYDVTINVTLELVFTLETEWRYLVCYFLLVYFQIRKRFAKVIKVFYWNR